MMTYRLPGKRFNRSGSSLRSPRGVWTRAAFGTLRPRELEHRELIGAFRSFSPVSFPQSDFRASEAPLLQRAFDLRHRERQRDCRVASMTVSFGDARRLSHLVRRATGPGGRVCAPGPFFATTAIMLGVRRFLKVAAPARAISGREPPGVAQQSCRRNATLAALRLPESLHRP